MKVQKARMRFKTFGPELEYDSQVFPVLSDGDRVVVWDPQCENELISCTRRFLDRLIERNYLRVVE